MRCGTAAFCCSERFIIKDEQLLREACKPAPGRIPTSLPMSQHAVPPQSLS
jgi:hypothetical protein